jgi:hypothetical protein
MKISKSHRRFSEDLKDPKALTNPEDFLGPNWEDVINFWLYVDTLSESEISKIGDRYYALDYIVRGSALDASSVAAGHVVGMKTKAAAWRVALYLTNDSFYWVFGDATWELIGSHKLLEQGKSPTFLPLCLKSKTTNQ